MLCVSVAERTLEACLSILDALREDEMAEIRVDLVSHLSTKSSPEDPGLSDEDLAKVWAHPRRKIATCRDLKGQEGSGFTAERRGVLEKAMATGTVQLVDLEYEAPEAYRVAVSKSASEHGVELIVSYHNYDETPSAESLGKIVDDCFVMGAGIAKVAVMAHSKRDAARVLALYGDERKVVALAMGEDGMITRIAAESLGADFTFVADCKEKATAPGQLTLAQMRAIHETVRGDGEPSPKKQKQ